MQVPVTIVQIFLTTHCNMKCPDCSCGMQVISKKDKYFIDWNYLESASKLFYGVDTISIMGGEPSMHPNFAEWSPKFKELFGCRFLTVESNGTMFKKLPEAFSHYDKIFATHYHPNMFEGCPENQSDIDYLKSLYGDKVWINEIVHVPRDTRGTDPCFRATSGGLAYEGGKLYPCAVGSGVRTNNFIIPTENWREEIKTIYPKCSDCYFAV